VTKMLSTAYLVLAPNRCKFDLATTSCVVSSKELRLTSSRLTLRTIYAIQDLQDNVAAFTALHLPSRQVNGRPSISS
jgi:hypothetical protein